MSDGDSEHRLTQGVILSSSDRGKPSSNPDGVDHISTLSRFWLKYKEILTGTASKSVGPESLLINDVECGHRGIDCMTPDHKLKQLHLHLKPKNQSTILDHRDTLSRVSGV